MNGLPGGYVYDTGPNTDRWVGWMTIEDAGRSGYAGSIKENWTNDIRRIVDYAIEQIGRRSGWEGDIREGPFVAGLIPDNDADTELVVAVALKQDNNGWIYIWSPYEMPWLGEAS